MPALIADLDPDARDLEGYLFPETYALPRGTQRGGGGGADGGRLQERADAGDARRRDRVPA